MVIFYHRYNIKSTNFESGEEKCLCNFILNWQHGPDVGNLTYATVGNICLIQHSTGIDPKVASFLKKSRDKIEMAYIITQLPKVGMEPKHNEYSHEMYSTSSINLFVAYVIVLPHLVVIIFPLPVFVGNKFW